MQVVRKLAGKHPLKFRQKLIKRMKDFPGLSVLADELGKWPNRQQQMERDTL